MNLITGFSFSNRSTLFSVSATPLWITLALIWWGASAGTVSAQIGAPNGASPTIDTDVGSLIATGCGYDAWTGSVRRNVVDFEVPGAVNEHGLKWERTYSSATGQWSFAYTWQLYYRPYYNTQNAIYPDGRQSHFEVGTKERYVQYQDSQGLQWSDIILDDGSVVHCSRSSADLGDPDHVPPTHEWIDYYTPVTLTDRSGRVTKLTWEGYGVNTDSGNIRLTNIEDPSGRSIHIYYDTPTNIVGYENCPSLVVGSDGQWAHYVWDTGRVLKHVDYSDGTTADYFNGSVKWGLNSGNTAVLLVAAHDSHASGPMQDIFYEYNNTGRFQGQIKAEHYLSPTASLASTPTPGASVSTFTSNSDNSATAAVQSETRGDAAVSRTIRMEKLNAGAGPPFVTYKTDYNGVQEKYFYNAHFFMNKITDRRGNSTNLTLENVVGNITSKIHPDTTHIDYVYTSPANPYWLASVTDENLKKTTFHRDSAVNPNMLTSIDYPTDVNTPVAHEYFYYDNTPANLVPTLGLVVQHVRKNGTNEFFQYQTDPNSPDYGLLLKAWNPINAGSVTDSDPHTTYTYYQPSDSPTWPGRVKSVTDPKGNTVTYAYDAWNPTASVPGQLLPGLFMTPPQTCTPYSGPEGTYPCRGRGLVTKVTNCDGSFKLFSYDRYGNKMTETDELNHTTAYTYDDYRRLKTTKLNDTTYNGVTETSNAITTNYYDLANGTFGGSPYSHTTKCLTKVVGPQACATPGITVTQTFDNNLRTLTKTEAPGTADAGMSSFGYDANGNQTSVTDARNNQTIITYDTRNRKSQATDPAPLNYFTQWGYDNASNVLTIRRKDGTTETKTYDAMNRVLTDKVPKDGTASLPTNYITTMFNYNPSGTLNWVQDGNGNKTNFAYDITTGAGAADLKTQMTYANNDYQTFAYDNNHNLTVRQIANQSAAPSPSPGASPTYQKFNYDCRNRRTEMWWSPNPTAGDTTDRLWANGVVEHNHYVYDLAGRMTQASNNFSTVNRTYDEDNRLRSDEQVLATGIDKTVIYHYDNAGENIRMHVDDGNGYDRDFCYDTRGRFKSIGDHPSGTNWFSYTYDAASNVMSRACALNGVTEFVPSGTAGYDVINRLLEKDQKLSTTTFAYEKYGYDAMSRMITIDREDAKRDTLGYNLDGEMISANYQWSNRTVGYNLDFLGNRTGANGVTDSVNGNKSYVVDNINRYSTAESSAVTSGGEHQVGNFQGLGYEYIGDSYVTSIVGGGNNYTPSYDALGRCVKRTMNSVTTYYVFDGEKPILEYTATGAIAGKNVYGKAIDEILMRTDYVINQSGQTYYYQEDHEGSVTHLTNGSGHVIEIYRYDAFGAPTTTYSEGNFNNRFKFTGREYIQQFGIYEYRARTYHPGLGRFMSEDSKGFDAGDYNLFRYCHNDPEDLTDPMGLLSSGESGMSESNENTSVPIHQREIGATPTGSHLPEVTKETRGTADAKGYHPSSTKVGGESVRFGEASGAGSRGKVVRDMRVDRTENNPDHCHLDSTQRYHETITDSSGRPIARTQVREIVWFSDCVGAPPPGRNKTWTTNEHGEFVDTNKLAFDVHNYRATLHQILIIGQGASQMSGYWEMQLSEKAATKMLGATTKSPGDTMYLY